MQTFTQGYGIRFFQGLQKTALKREYSSWVFEDGKLLTMKTEKTLLGKSTNETAKDIKMYTSLRELGFSAHKTQFYNGR